jgi:hypothetical protein
MDDQSGVTRFRVSFDSALQAYQQVTGVILVEHPLTVQLQYPHTIESITTILKYEARVSSGLLGCDGIVKSIESIVSLLFSLSAIASFSDAIVLVRKEELRSSVYTSLTTFIAIPTCKGNTCWPRYPIFCRCRSPVPMWVSL